MDLKVALVPFLRSAPPALKILRLDKQRIWSYGGCEELGDTIDALASPPKLETVYMPRRRGWIRHAKLLEMAFGRAEGEFTSLTLVYEDVQENIKLEELGVVIRA